MCTMRKTKDEGEWMRELEKREGRWSEVVM